MSAMEQTHVHQMENVSIQMVPLHVTVPLATSWISMDRAAQVNASQVHYMQSCAKRVSLFFVQTRHTPHHLAFILHSTYHHHMFKEESPKHVKPTSPLMYVELLHTPGFRAYVLYISIRSMHLYMHCVSVIITYIHIFVLHIPCRH